MGIARKDLLLSSVRIDGGTQPREKIDTSYIDEIAELPDELFPPIDVYFDGREHWLADGFHRYHRSRKLNRATISANIVTGTQRDAILHSVGANDSHGLRRTNADKRRAVLTLLKDDEWGAKSAAWIAEKCRVSDTYVGNLRKEIHPASTSNVGGGKVEGKDGRTMRTENFKKPKSSAATSNVGSGDDSTPAPKTSPKKPTDTSPKIPARVESAFINASSLTDRAMELTRQLAEVITKLIGDDKSSKTSDGGELLSARRINLRVDLKNIREALKSTRPHAVCPYCKAQKPKCDACKSLGWVCQSVFEEAPADLKKQLGRAA